MTYAEECLQRERSRYDLRLARHRGGQAAYNRELLRQFEASWVRLYGHDLPRPILGSPGLP